VANIYLRPVNERDIPKLKEIYSWYAHSSFESPETLGLNDDEVRQRIEGTHNAMLPFIVAVDRRSASTNAETILGYALAKEFEPHRASQYTAELEVYVKEGHTGLGIGRCLLDKLLEVCDPTYRSRSGYQFEATHQERSGYFPGGRRKLARLLFTLGYVDHEISKYNRVKRWLKEYADFEEQGVLRGVRIKRKFL
jgi:L-amino acid N-acyltransferase YncA